jgi:hypothetical protein
MYLSGHKRLLWACAAVLAVTTAVLASAAQGRTRAAGFTLFASGLDNPRGLTFGPDGDLYVAEGGDAALNGLRTDGPPALCDQVAPGTLGPYLGGFTSRISKIDANGNRTTVVEKLPSSSTSPGSGSLTSGVADVKFLDGTLYGIEAGAGCSHGLANTDNTLFRVNVNAHTITQVADLSVFQKAHPVAHDTCCPGDFEPDGTWYSMVASRGAIYAVEPNHGEVDRITPDGSISRVVDVSATQGHVVPTSLSVHGNFYFGNLGTFPVTPGDENVWKLTPSGHLSVVASGLTTVLGTAWRCGRLYALESVTAANWPVPGVDPSGTGRVVRIDGDGTQTTVVDGLTVPTAMAFGPDGRLYISNLGFGTSAGQGQVVRADLGLSCGGEDEG